MKKGNATKNELSRASHFPLLLIHHCILCRRLKSSPVLLATLLQETQTPSHHHYHHLKKIWPWLLFLGFFFCKSHLATDEFFSFSRVSPTCGHRYGCDQVHQSLVPQNRQLASLSQGKVRLYSPHPQGCVHVMPEDSRLNKCSGYMLPPPSVYLNSVFTWAAIPMPSHNERLCSSF